MSITFEDYSVSVKAAISEAVSAFLEESGGEIAAQAARNTRVDTGQTKGAWGYAVDESEQSVSIGNPLENAIWEEFGTGEYALNGNGRKGGWAYEDAKGEKHFTYGKRPTRALHNAMEGKKGQIIKAAESRFKELDHD